VIDTLSDKISDIHLPYFTVFTHKKTKLDNLACIVLVKTNEILLFGGIIHESTWDTSNTTAVAFPAKPIILISET